jgi:hypothetical protein
MDAAPPKEMTRDDNGDAASPQVAVTDQPMPDRAALEVLDGGYTGQNSATI